MFKTRSIHVRGTEHNKQCVEAHKLHWRRYKNHEYKLKKHDCIANQVSTYCIYIVNHHTLLSEHLGNLVEAQRFINENHHVAAAKIQVIVMLKFACKLETNIHTEEARCSASYFGSVCRRYKNHTHIHTSIPYCQ